MTHVFARSWGVRAVRNGVVDADATSVEVLSQDEERMMEDQ
jgi:hypothetical protein